jgi:hypothetical protein
VGAPPPCDRARLQHGEGQGEEAFLEFEMKHKIGL